MTWKGSVRSAANRWLAPGGCRHSFSAQLLLLCASLQGLPPLLICLTFSKTPCNTFCPPPRIYTILIKWPQRWFTLYFLWVTHQTAHFKQCYTAFDPPKIPVLLQGSSAIFPKVNRCQRAKLGTQHKYDLGPFLAVVYCTRPTIIYSPWTSLFSSSFREEMYHRCPEPLPV